MAQLVPEAGPAPGVDAAPAPPVDSAPAPPMADAAPPLPSYAAAWPAMNPPIPDPMAQAKCEELIMQLCTTVRACPGAGDLAVGACVQRRRAEIGGCSRVAAISDRASQCTDRLTGLGCPDGGPVLPAACDGVLILRP